MLKFPRSLDAGGNFWPRRESSPSSKKLKDWESCIKKSTLTTSTSPGRSQSQPQVLIHLLHHPHPPPHLKPTLLPQNLNIWSNLSMRNLGTWKRWDQTNGPGSQPPFAWSSPPLQAWASSVPYLIKLQSLSQSCRWPHPQKYQQAPSAVVLSPSTQGSMMVTTWYLCQPQVASPKWATTQVIQPPSWWPPWQSSWTSTMIACTILTPWGIKITPKRTF